MGLFSKDDDKEAQGGLSLLSKLQNTVVGSQGGSDTGPWSDAWAARKLWAMRLKPGEETEVVLLDDIKVFAAAELITGWNDKGGKSWPRTDFARVLNYDDDVEELNVRCPLTEVLGRTRLLGVVPVMTSQESKGPDGDTRPYSLRLLIVKSSTVLEVLTLASKASGQDLKFSSFKVRRGTGNKIPAIGDIWHYTGHLEESAITEVASTWKDELSEVDLDAGYPMLTVENAVAILGTHVRQSDAHSSHNNSVIGYNQESWDYWKTGDASSTSEEGDTMIGGDAGTDDFDLEL